MDASEPDGIYGDEAALEASCNAGAEQLQYLMKHTKALDWLSTYTGFSGGDPQVPQELLPLDAELPPSWDDWE